VAIAADNDAFLLVGGAPSSSGAVYSTEEQIPTGKPSSTPTHAPLPAGVSDLAIAGVVLACVALVGLILVFTMMVMRPSPTAKDTGAEAATGDAPAATMEVQRT
jgi:hypothetical protein